MADERSAFVRLRNVDTSFQNRSDSIFERLSNLEPTAENSPSETQEESAKKQQRNAKSTRLPARVPQHILSPEKWTKYSLENDGSDAFRGLNEHNLNKYAAHTFLADLKKRKSAQVSNENSLDPPQSSEENWKPEKSNRVTALAPESKTGLESDLMEENQQTLVDNTGTAKRLKSDNELKFLFKKPEPKPKVTSSASNAAMFKEGTYVMPEYVVGSAPSKGRPKVERSSGVKAFAGNDVVNLGHLGDECREELGEGSVTSEKDEGKMAKQKGKRVFRKRKVEDEGIEDEKVKKTEIKRCFTETA